MRFERDKLLEDLRKHFISNRMVQTNALLSHSKGKLKISNMNELKNWVTLLTQIPHVKLLKGFGPSKRWFQEFRLSLICTIEAEIKKFWPIYFKPNHMYFPNQDITLRKSKYFFFQWYDLLIKFPPLLCFIYFLSSWLLIRKCQQYWQSINGLDLHWQALILHGKRRGTLAIDLT